MHFFVLATFAFLVSSVAGSGLRNGYERVWLWYAYQIDLELPVDQRKIGVRCIKFDEGNNNCPAQYEKKDRKGNSLGMFDNFEPCKGTRGPNKDCYFYEFMGHIDKTGVQWKQNFYLPVSYTDPAVFKNDKAKEATVKAEQEKLDPDPKAAAEWLSVEHPPKTDWNPVRAVQYRPFRAFKGANKVYNNMLRSVADHSAATIAGLSADRRAAMQGNIDAIKTSLRAVNIEREIDHSKRIIKANDDLGTNKFKMFTYTETGHNGDIVDWDKSAALQTGNDVARFNTWRSNYYTNPIAQEHQQVMDDFRYVENKYSPPASCAGP
ncbi:hypothetical protein GQ44DRAFT_780423 [Phaeosphaeriaceae sp. PMI808]|nr:hypothetical protein GQ44DRAFT_780423 [Phaeosphaeriaceae sp. PMI808]